MQCIILHAASAQHANPADLLHCSLPVWHVIGFKEGRGQVEQISRTQWECLLNLNLLLSSGFQRWKEGERDPRHRKPLRPSPRRIAPVFMTAHCLNKQGVNETVRFSCVEIDAISNWLFNTSERKVASSARRVISLSEALRRLFRCTRQVASLC